MTYLQTDSAHVDEWVAPDACDDQGVVRPGKVLEWMEAIGGLGGDILHRRAVKAAAAEAALGRIQNLRATVGDRRVADFRFDLVHFPW